MCRKHLKSPSHDDFQIVNSVEIKPSSSPESISKQIKLVNALMAMSPSKLMTGKKLARYKKQLKKAMEANEKTVEVVELTKVSDGDNMDYYSDFCDEDRSAATFKVFKPESEKTQIAIDSKTKEVLFVIPDLGGWNRNDQNTFKKCLIKCLAMKPNFSNKSAKVRRTKATKWSMIGNI